MNRMTSFVLLCALLIMCFSGCANLGDKDSGPNENNAQNSNEDNINGSNDDGNSTDDINNNDLDYIIVETAREGDPKPQYAMSAKIPKKCTLSEAHMPISLSYGLLYGAGVSGDSYTHIILKAVNKDDGHMVILDTLNIEEILKLDYTVTPLWDNEHKWIVGFDYSYTESCTLPLSLFSGDSGRICISMFEYNSADPDGLRGSGTGVIFYYTRYDTYISVSMEKQDS